MESAKKEILSELKDKSISFSLDCYKFFLSKLKCIPTSTGGSESSITSQLTTGQRM
jgi:hypothetical protein